MAHLLRSPPLSSPLSTRKLFFPLWHWRLLWRLKEEEGFLASSLMMPPGKEKGNLEGEGGTLIITPQVHFHSSPLSPSSQSPKQKKALNRSSKIEEIRWFLFRSRTESFSISCIFSSSSSFSHTFEYLFCILGTLDDWRRRRRPNRFVSLFLSPPRNLLGFSL